MDILLLGITIVSLIVALVMSVTAWRLMREEKQRSAARVAALSVAAADDTPQDLSPQQSWPQESFPAREAFESRTVKAPWRPAAAATDVPLNARVTISEPTITHATGFLGAAEVQREEGNRQKSLAFAAVVLFLALSGGLVWMMSGPRGTSAQAMGPNAPLELVSLTHERHDNKIDVSGLVRNPVNGKPVEHLSAVVFLFDRTGTFVSSARANVDFLKLGAGDETPFVVSLDAPPTVARYRVSFRTDEGIVPHVDRRSSAPAPTAGEQPVNVTLK